MATTADVANAINNALLSPLKDYEPISEFTETVALEENPVFLELTTHRVYNNFQHLNKFKAPGPDAWASKLGVKRVRSIFFNQSILSATS